MWILNDIQYIYLVKLFTTYFVMYFVRVLSITFQKRHCREINWPFNWKVRYTLSEITRFCFGVRKNIELPTICTRLDSMKGVLKLIISIFWNYWIVLYHRMQNKLEMYGVEKIASFSKHVRYSNLWVTWNPK